MNLLTTLLILLTFITRSYTLDIPPVDTDNGQFLFPRDPSVKTFAQFTKINITWEMNYDVAHLTFHSINDPSNSITVASNINVNFFYWYIQPPAGYDVSVPVVFHITNATLGTDSENKANAKAGFTSAGLYIIRSLSDAGAGNPKPSSSKPVTSITASSSAGSSPPSIMPIPSDGSSPPTTTTTGNADPSTAAAARPDTTNLSAASTPSAQADNYPDSNPAAPTLSSTNTSSKVGAIAGGTCGGGLAAILIAAGWVFWRKRRESRTPKEIGGSQQRRGEMQSSYFRG